MAQESKKQFEALITNIAGEEAVPLVRFLKNRKDVSEFEIAEKIGEEVNAARSILYKLHQANLVASSRKRDEERGWYTYYWSFRPEMIPKLSRKIMNFKLNELREKLDKETNGIRYICKNNCTILDFDLASSLNFKCPECGLVMDPKENDREYVDSLRIKIRTIEKEII